jgi:GT2 family glycosyltransferase
MSAERAPVAVVIVSWNSERHLDTCLASVFALERVPAEVVVVDAGSSDGSLALVRDRYPAVELVACGENVGFCRGNNLGIARTRSPFVLALNPDTRLEPGFLERLLPAFRDPRVGIAGGKLLRFDGRTLDSAGQLLARSRQPVDRGYGEPDRGRLDRDGEVFGICGAAALYRRSMLDSIVDPGGQYFDEAFFAFVEDLDLAWRARRLGWRALYCHRAVGYHARGATAERPTVNRRASMLSRNPELRFHIVKNRYLTILRNDRLRSYLGNLPWVLGRDAATCVLLLVSSPGVLVRLARARALFAEARRKRRLDAGRPGYQL